LSSFNLFKHDEKTLKMSWNPFTKNASTTRRSVFTKSLDRDVEREQRKLESLEETTKKLQKDLKRCNDSTHEFAQANLKISTNLKNSPLYAQDNDFSRNVDHCYQAAKELETASQSVVAVATKTAVEPTKKIATVFPAANAEVKRRREKSEEVEKLQLKVDKLREKERTGPNIIKLDTAERQLDQVKRDFDQTNDALMKDLAEFDHRKTDYFQPCVEALLCAEALFFKDATAACEKALVNTRIKHDEGTVSGTTAMQTMIQQKLSEIKSLSIVVHR